MIIAPKMLEDLEERLRNFKPDVKYYEMQIESCLDQAKRIREEHRRVMKSREKLPFEHRPLDAPIWMEKLSKARRLEEQAERAKKEVEKLKSERK